MTVKIIGMATGVPENRYPQMAICEKLLTVTQGERRRDRAVRAIFERAGVDYRHMVVDEHYFERNRTTQERNDLYMAEAVPLCEKTILAALKSAGLTAAEVDDLIVVSCTGFSVPGLDLILAGRLGMRPDLRRTCVLGMGCYGAFPAMLRAQEAAAAGRTALVVAVELCSLHLQFDLSAESVVSSALFGDGAGAVVMRGAVDDAGRDEISHSHSGLPMVVGSKTYCNYQTLDHMSFTITDHGFRMYLSSYVPDLLAAGIGDFVDSLLDEHGLKREDIQYWGIHPGSQKIVEYIRDQLKLSCEQTARSLNTLECYGNMSSATILFILEQIQQQESPPPGTYGVFMAFGPGLTMESMLVRW